MRGPLMTFALWLGATAIAVGVGLSATRLVASSVTGPPADIATGLAQDRGASPPSPGASPPPIGSPPPAESPPETRTLSAVGGDAALRFHDDRVEVLWATPNAGFTVDVEDDPDQGEARIDFRSPNHRSRMTGEWDDGRPSIEVEERPDD